MYAGCAKLGFNGLGWNDSTVTIFLRRSIQIKTMMNAKSIAAPPMATPAIPPGLRTAGAGAEVDEGVCEAGVDAVVEGDDAEVGDDTADGVNAPELVALAPPLVTTPLGPKFTYAPQSGFCASGQVSSWHKLYNCVPTAGEQRTLYLAFNCRES